MAGRPVKKRKLISPHQDELEDEEGDLSDSISSQQEESDGESYRSADEEDAVSDADKAPDAPSSKQRWQESRRTNIQNRRPLNRPQMAMSASSSKSNLFALQADELLGEIRLNHGKAKAKFEGTLRKLKDAIENIPNRPALPAREAKTALWKNAKVALPMPPTYLGKETKYSLEYSRPASINVVGSLALKTSVKTKSPHFIDLAVTMPKTLFQDKDYLNHRYFHKRAYYVACIAAGLQATNDPFNIKYGYQNDNVLQPILIIQPEEGTGENQHVAGFQIRIITAVADDSFPASKLLPYKCNIRNQLSIHDPSKPTPGYNGALLAEATVTAYLKFVHSASLQCEAFTDATLLGRTWLRQRGLDTGMSAGGFGTFEWTVMCAALLQGGGPNGKRVLSPMYSHQQLFRAMLQFLAGPQFGRPFLWNCTDKEIASSSGPMFYDGIRNHNVLYKMTPWSYHHLRNEAQITLQMLQDSRFDHFDSIFILMSDQPLLRSDVLVKLFPDKTTDLMGFQKRLYDVTRRSLGDRANTITVSINGQLPWPLKFSSPPRSDAQEVTVGIQLNADHARRSIDHGPSAEDKEASAEFREFWGEKAELRRFKDGSILESLVWSYTGDDPVSQILMYSVGRHFGKDVAKNASIVSGQVDRAFWNDIPSTETTASFQPFIDAFQLLERKVRDLDGLPLSLNQLSATDPQLRYTSIQPPGSTKARLPAEAVLQFEGSGRWPDDLAAAQQTKTAFLLKIGELLETAVEGLVARVGTEHEDRQLLNKSFLDLVYPNGFSFRLRIHHDREQMFLENLLKDKKMNSRLRDEAAVALATYKRTFVQSVRHTQAVRTLCTRFPCLSPSIRLFKKWCSSHLLSNHFSEELMELFVIRVFVQSYPWQTPSSTQIGFLRTLHMLSRWDWPREPLIIDCNGTLTPHEIANMTTRFEAWRKIDPAMNSVALFVASNLDPDGVTWTQGGRPPKVATARLIGLATAATKKVKESDELPLDISSLFSSSLDEYDFVIHLKDKFARDKVNNNHHHQSAISSSSSSSSPTSKFKNLQVQAASSSFSSSSSNSNSSIAGFFDPATQFLTEIEHIYGGNSNGNNNNNNNNSIVVFFHNGGSLIAGLWNPQAVTARPFRLKLGWSSIPMSKQHTNEAGDEEEEEKLVTVNKSGIVNEIAALGGDMIKKVVVHGTC